MLCRNPYSRPYGKRAYYPCGQCNPCRFNRARLWTSRLMLESFCHDHSCFVTLTYDPQFYDGATLVPDDVSRWLKRLRKELSPTKIRYFLVGEYGDRTERPHYHLALFGAGPEVESILRDKWRCPRTGISMGHVHVGDLSPHSARYITGYVVKKLRKGNDKLGNRYPEFARMSKGIGRDAIPSIAAAVDPYLDATVDVPTFVRGGNKTFPLGRYLRKKLRQQLDYYTVDGDGVLKYGQSKKAEKASDQEMQNLYDVWIDDPAHQKKSFKEFLSSLDDGSVALMESRLDNRNHKRKL